MKWALFFVLLGCALSGAQLVGSGPQCTSYLSTAGFDVTGVAACTSFDQDVVIEHAYTEEHLAAFANVQEFRGSLEIRNTAAATISFPAATMTDSLSVTDASVTMLNFSALATVTATVTFENLVSLTTVNFGSLSSACGFSLTNTGLQGLYLPQLAGHLDCYITITNNPSLKELSAPLVTHITQNSGLVVETTPLEILNMPMLEEVLALEIKESNNLKTLNLDKLAMAQLFRITTAGPYLTSLSLPALTTAPEFYVQGALALTVISLPLLSSVDNMISITYAPELMVLYVPLLSDPNDLEFIELPKMCCTVLDSLYKATYSYSSWSSPGGSWYSSSWYSGYWDSSCSADLCACAGAALGSTSANVAAVYEDGQGPSGADCLENYVPIATAPICEDGTWTSTDDFCGACGTGQVANMTSYECVCDVDFEAEGDACVACTPGKHRAADKTACECMDQYEPNGANCTACGAGKYKNATALPTDACMCMDQYEPNGDVCTACTPGKYKAATALASDACVCMDQYEPHGANCTACAAGKYKNATALPSDACMCMDQYEPNGDVCTACAAGKYKPADALTTDMCVCLDGYEPSGDICVACSSGKYKPEDALPSDACVCMDNFEPNGNNCTACAAGKYKPAGSLPSDACVCMDNYEPTGSDCTVCPTGKYKPVNATADSACICQSGYEPSGTACVACAAGKYKLATAAASAACVQCPNGTASTDTGRTTVCPACAAGAVSGIYGLDTTHCYCSLAYTGPTDGPCTACATGKFRYNLASNTCETCTKVNETDCIVCPTGKSLKFVDGTFQCRGIEIPSSAPRVVFSWIATLLLIALSITWAY